MLKLGNGSEAVWKPAREELEYLDPRLALDLPELMSRYTETPGRQRMVELISGRAAGSLKTQDSLMKVQGGYNFVVKTGRGNASFWAEPRVERLGSPTWDYPRKKWTRAIRAIVLLRYFGAPGGGDPEGHGHRASRHSADQGGQGGVAGARRLVRKRARQPASGIWMFAI